MAIIYEQCAYFVKISETFQFITGWTTFAVTPVNMQIFAHFARNAFVLLRIVACIRRDWKKMTYCGTMCTHIYATNAIIYNWMRRICAVIWRTNIIAMTMTADNGIRHFYFCQRLKVCISNLIRRSLPLEANRMQCQQCQQCQAHPHRTNSFCSLKIHATIHLQMKFKCWKT